MSKTDDNIPQSLKRIEVATVKLIKKLPKRPDVDYTVQTSINSTRPKTVDWAVQITPPAQGLAPITLIGKTPESLIERLTEYAKYIDYDEVEVAWHKAQVDAAKRTIDFHEERVQRISIKKKILTILEEGPNKTFAELCDGIKASDDTLKETAINRVVDELVDTGKIDSDVSDTGEVYYFKIG